MRLTQVGGAVARKLKGEMQTSFTETAVDYTVGLQVTDPFLGYVYENEEYFADPQQVPFETKYFPDELSSHKWKKQKKWATKRQVKTDSASQLGLVYLGDWKKGMKIPDDAMKDKLAVWYDGQFYSIGADIGFTSRNFDADLDKDWFVSAKSTTQMQHWRDAGDVRGWGVPITNDTLKKALSEQVGYSTLRISSGLSVSVSEVTIPELVTLKVDGELVLEESNTFLLNMLSDSKVIGNGRLLERLGASHNVMVMVDATKADNYQLKDIVVDISIETEVRSGNDPTFGTTTAVKGIARAHRDTPSPKNSYIWNLSVRRPQQGGFAKNIDLEVDLSRGNAWIHDTSIRDIRSQYSGGSLVKMVGVNFTECVNLIQQGWSPSVSSPAFDLQDCNTVRFEGCNSWDRNTHAYDLKNCKKVSIRDDVSEAENPGFYVREDDLCEDNDYFMDIWGDVNTNLTYRRAGKSNKTGGSDFLQPGDYSGLFTIGNMANGSKAIFTIKFWSDSNPIYAEYKGYILATTNNIVLTSLRALAVDESALFPKWVGNMEYCLDFDSFDKQVHFRYHNQHPIADKIGYEIEVDYAPDLAKGGTPKIQKYRYLSGGAFTKFTEIDLM